MPPLLKFLNVSLYKDQEFGICDIGFEIQKYRKYHFILPSQEKLETLLGLLEGRFQPQAGIVHRYTRIFTQSDRLLLGDKVYDSLAGSFLKLREEQFYFEDRKRSKQTFLHELKARHIRHFPVYKLKGEDRLKFALLALTFQENGLILISKLLQSNLSTELENHLQRIIRGTSCAVCLLTSEDQHPNRIATLWGDVPFSTIDLR